MKRISYSLLKMRRLHGFYRLLLSVLLVLSAVTSSRADVPTVITNDLSVITNGGAFTFQTNGTFTLTNSIAIVTNTQIDATGLNVILSGGNVTRIFAITNATLTLTGLQITGGKSSQGAAIYNKSGTLMASNVVFAKNNATNGPAANGTDGRSGSINGNAGGAGVAGDGGAIYSDHGTLLLTNCTFTNNFAAGGNGGNGGNGFNDLGGNGGDGGAGGIAQGGAIYSTGTNIIIGCYFVANGAFGGSGGGGGNSGTGSISGATGAGGQGDPAVAGAIYIPAGGILNVTNCTFAGNEAFGGNSGPQKISGNGVSLNGKDGGPALGGAIENFGIFNIENSTFFLNACHGGSGGDTLGDPSANAGTGGYAEGGAVANVATFVARNCTFATNNTIGGTNGVSPFSNRNGATGPVHGGNLARVSGTSKIINCILQHGAGTDSYNGVTDGGFNISSDTSCAFTSTNSLSKTNANMAAILNTYPGYPPVLEIVLPSCAHSRIPAIPADNPTNCPVADQRGALRFTTNLLSDVGAFEAAPSPPRILIQPLSLAVIKGANATFTVSAVGDTPLVYQWQFLPTNGPLVLLPLATNTSLTITNVQATNFGSYFVVITNGLGSVTSSNAVLSTEVAPGITSQTSDVTVDLGGTAVFSVVATGAPLNFQWYSNNVALTESTHYVGATTASLTITSATHADQGTYKLVVTNSLGTINSSPVKLTVNDPAFVTQPSDVTVNFGAPAVLTVLALSSSTNTISYQWRHGPNVISATNKIAGATKTTYTNSPATNDTYTVVASNALGTVTSDAATVTVQNPAITAPPTNLVVDLGAPAVFHVTATGTGTLTYRWNFNGAPIVPPATNSSYTISTTAATNAGSYTVTVSNGTNSPTSPPATLVIRGGSTISGRITFGTNGVDGVTIGNGTTNVVSASNGTFSFTNLLAGSYPITPVQVGSGLTPATNTVAVDGVNSTNINFAFNPPLLQITAAIASNSIPVRILSAPLQHSTLQSSSDLTNWVNGSTFITDTNGAFNAAVTNDTAFPYLFLRLTSP